MSSDPILPPNSDPSPLPPTGDPGSPLSTDLSQTTSTGLAPNVAAGLAALLILVAGIIFILIEKKNQFVRFWAMQSIFFGAALIILNIVLAIVGRIIMHIPLIGILWSLFSLVVSLAILAVWIITIVKAFSGKVWEIPVIGQLARAQLAKTPLL